MENAFCRKLSGRNFKIEGNHFFLRWHQGMTVPFQFTNLSIVFPYSAFYFSALYLSHLAFMKAPHPRRCNSPQEAFLDLVWNERMSGWTHSLRKAWVRTGQHHCCRDCVQLHSVMRIAAVRLSAPLEGWFPEIRQVSLMPVHESDGPGWLKEKATGTKSSLSKERVGLTKSGDISSTWKKFKNSHKNS